MEKIQKETPNQFNCSQKSVQEKLICLDRTKKIKKKKNYKRKTHKTCLKIDETSQEKLIRYYEDIRNQYLNTKMEENLSSINSYIQTHTTIQQLLSLQNESIFKIPENLDNYQYFIEYFNFLKNTQERKIVQISLSNTNKRVNFSVLLPKKRMKKISVLTEYQQYVLNSRKSIPEGIQNFITKQAQRKNLSNPNLSEFQKEIFFLCKINAKVETKVKKIIEQKTDIIKTENIPQVLKISSRDEYISQLIRKNLQHSFCEKKIDFLNYFRQNENIEKEEYDEKEAPLKNQKEFLKYIENKKPKVNKPSEKLLKTACTGCFSDYYEMSNPIINCPECKMRIHKQRCDRCQYNRTSNLEKEKTKYCLLCGRKNEKNLLIRKINNESPFKYVHIYCMLLHNLWQVVNQKVEFKSRIITSIEDECIVCRKIQRGEIGVRCKFCFKQMHGMCAYLQGFSFNISDVNNQKYFIEVNCCNSPQIQERIKKQRKFKINYDKEIFRNTDQFFKIHS